MMVNASWWTRTGHAASPRAPHRSISRQGTVTLRTASRDVGHSLPAVLAEGTTGTR